MQSGWIGVGLALVAACTKAAPTAAPAEPAATERQPTDAVPPRTTPFRIGVLYWSATIQGQVIMREGLEAEAARMQKGAKGPGVELISRVAGDGPEGQRRQIDQMRELLTLGLDAIIVQPTDNTALGPPLREANAAGIPVVAYDQYIEGGALASFVTSDNRQAGTLAGEYISSRFPNERELSLVLVEYPAVSSTVERLDGFLATLRASGQRVRIAATYQAVEPVAGAQVGARILHEFPTPGSIDVVFTVNDGGGLAVVEALAKAGREEILVATIDGDPASVENIRQGRLTVIDAAQFCGPLGAAAMRSTYALLLGERVPPHQLIPTFPVTRETLDRYPGWGGPLPPAFVKPWPSSTPEWSPKVRKVRVR